MKMELFEKIVSQLKPWTNKEWNQWIDFVQHSIGIKENEMNENHFFYYVIPKVITLHGFGEPLLDKYIVERVKCLTKHHIPSYFSCHPQNINIETCMKLFDAGLTYLKFSSERIEDFQEKYANIHVLNFIKHEGDFKTKVIIDVVGDKAKLRKLQGWFPGTYVYVKHQDNQWYVGTKKKTPVAHLSGPCQFPWSSLTVLWDGSVVPCNQDFNAEMKLGDANKQSLKTIWNSKKYQDFRKLHLMLNKPLKCIDRCDMQLLVGEL
jgi:radical SAM protein with 4Fe4S-binding SPASM domain